MPTYPIQLKRNGTAAATPSSLLHGEVALNYADGKLFWKDASNVIQSFTFQAYALSSHTHAASDITSGTLDAARIANDSITYAKLQNVSATDRLLGRSSAGAGDVEEITCTSFGRSLIDDADAAAARTTLSVQPTASPAFTGAATFDNTGNVVPLTVTNAGTANSFVVNDASGDTSPFVIDASGNVGIGITPTSLPLTVFSFATSDADKATLLLNGTVASGQSFAGIRFTHNVFSTGWAADIRCVDTGNFGGILSFRTSATGSATATPTERLKIDAAGVSTFSGQLLVTAGSGSSGSYKPGVAVSGDDDTGLQQVGGANTISLVTAGSERVRVDASGNVGVGKSPSYRLDVLGDLGIDSAGNAVLRYGRNNSYKWAIYNDTSDNFIFYSDAAFAERLRISSTGEVIVGTTDQGAYNLQCNGTGVWGAGAYVNGSDERIKDEIAPIGEATNVITAMQPVTFRYKPTWSSDQSIQPGFIAQQLQEALAGAPYLDGVVQQGTEYLSVAYQSLIPLLVKALQESNARIAALEERINA